MKGGIPLHYHMRVDNQGRLHLPDYITKYLGFQKGYSVVYEDNYDRRQDKKGFTAFLYF